MKVVESVGQVDIEMRPRPRTTCRQFVESLNIGDVFTHIKYKDSAYIRSEVGGFGTATGINYTLESFSDENLNMYVLRPHAHLVLGPEKEQE